MRVCHIRRMGLYIEILPPEIGIIQLVIGNVVLFHVLFALVCVLVVDLNNKHCRF
jgi:hypothetical protein